MLISYNKLGFMDKGFYSEDLKDNRIVPVEGNENILERPAMATSAKTLTPTTGQGNIGSRPHAPEIKCVRSHKSPGYTSTSTQSINLFLSTNVPPLRISNYHCHYLILLNT